MTVYKIVFAGELKQEEQLQQVKLRLQKLFRMDTDKTELLFSGKPVIVKDYLDRPQAVKYQQAFDQCGAICTIAPSGINSEGSTSGDGDADNRNYHRLTLRSQAKLILDSADIIRGTILDASFNGFFLQTQQQAQIVVGQQGMIQISLCEFNEDSLVVFACEVKRLTDDGIGLGMISTEDSRLSSQDDQRSQVVVRRSSGMMEEGWSVLHPNDPLPDGLMQNMQRYEQMGPVAIVYKKGTEEGQDFFRIEPIKALMLIQKFVNSDPDERTVSHHLVDPK